MSKLVYVLPVHNEAQVLESNVTRIADYLELHHRGSGTEIFLVENGSKDDSWALSQTIAKREVRVPIHAFQEPNAGIGFAYHRGLLEALERFGPSSERWAILTAADLPFAFTDLEAAMVLLGRSGPRMMIGSKAHPDSVADMGRKRRLMSFVYRGARRAALGMRVGDSQGSVFLRLDLAGAIVPKIRARNFFYTTELCHYAEREGESIVELPVVLEEERRASTVRPWKHGSQMARQLWELRKRER